MMVRKPSADELRHAVKTGESATTPEQARDALITIGDVLGGTDRKKCHHVAQTFEDARVMKICRETATSVEKKAGFANPWWKFW